jgi:predicted nucleic-acid-binding protein
MNAVDTNVLVRYLVNDDAEQAARARVLMEGGPVWLGMTVLLETEWVLRSAGGFPRREIAAVLRALAGQPTIHVENESAVERALALCEGGMDFADALHVSVCEEAEYFWTFDTRLVELAGRLGVTKVMKA